MEEPAVNATAPPPAFGKIMVLAGEKSGDQHAAALCRELAKLRPGLEMFGMGGDEMEAAGVELVERITGHSVVGIWEAVRELGRFRRLFNYLAGVMEERRPDVVVLVDFPGFNLRFARRARRRGIATAYYICPQVWAWGRGRVKQLKRFVDRLLVIFPFEREFFRRYGIEAEFVGHPLADVLASFPDREAARRRLELSPGPVVGLLPGSRPGEIGRIYPVLIEAASLLAARRPQIQFVTPISSPDLREMAESLAGTFPGRLRLVDGRSREVMAASDLLLVASGTATLEGAVLGVPMEVVYRVSFLSWLAGMVLVKIPYISLVNIVSGRCVVPEYIQRAARPEEIAARAEELLAPGPRRQAMTDALRGVRTKLGEPGAAARAARVIMEMPALSAPSAEKGR